MNHLVNPDHTGMSIKDQMCDLTSLLVVTLHQVYAVFYPDSDSSKGKGYFVLKLYLNFSLESNALFLSSCNFIENSL